MAWLGLSLGPWDGFSGRGVVLAVQCHQLVSPHEHAQKGTPSEHDKRVRGAVWSAGTARARPVVSQGQPGPPRGVARVYQVGMVVGCTRVVYCT